MFYLIYKWIDILGTQIAFDLRLQLFELFSIYHYILDAIIYVSVNIVMFNRVTLLTWFIIRL